MKDFTIGDLRKEQSRRLWKGMVLIMKKKLIILCGMLALESVLLIGCADKNVASETAADVTEQATVKETEQTAEEVTIEEVTEEPTTEEQLQAELPDGVYAAEFHTDSSMFHVSEACDGKGTLTVENGKMTIHISLGSKNIVNLYPGLAEDAGKEGAELLAPTEDMVTYSDGMTEEVYGFDVPVPTLNQEFDLALIGTKEIWYDHKVSVSNPEPIQEETESVVLEDGTYTMDLTFEGGSGKAQILSPVTVTVTDGTAIATVQWNSPNYDYMIVDGEKYLPVNTEGDSVFEIPVLVFDEAMDVIGDTVAMSKPYEIEYTLTFHSDTRKPVE